MFSRLADDNPAVAYFKTYLASVHRELAGLLIEINDLDAAAQSLDAAAAVWQDDSTKNKAKLHECLLTSGLIAEQRDRVAESITFYQRCLKFGSTYIRTPENHSFMALKRLGSLYEQTGKQAYRDAILRKLILACLRIEGLGSDYKDVETAHQEELKTRRLLNLPDGPLPNLDDFFESEFKQAAQEASSQLKGSTPAADKKTYSQLLARARFGKIHFLGSAYCCRAWRLATHPDGSKRNGELALQYVQAAFKMDAEVRDTKGMRIPSGALFTASAAALAELGEFDEALEWIEKSLEYAKKGQRKTTTLELIRTELQAKRPYRHMPGKKPPWSEGLAQRSK